MSGRFPREQRMQADGPTAVLEPWIAINAAIDERVATLHAVLVVLIDPLSHRRCIAFHGWTPETYIRHLQAMARASMLRCRPATRRRRARPPVTRSRS